MRQFLASLLVLGVCAVPATAADPSGDWRVEDGTAVMRIANCDGKIWGVVAWSEKTGGLDVNNPDPAKRNRPLLGLPIIRGMQQTKANVWNGPIYNPRNGKTYDGVLTLKKPTVLEVEGCVMGGWICGGQDWTRVATPRSNVGVGASTAQTAQDTSAVPALCLALFGPPGSTHQGRLK